MIELSIRIIDKGKIIREGRIVADDEDALLQDLAEAESTLTLGQWIDTDNAEIRSFALGGFQ